MKTNRELLQQVVQQRHENDQLAARLRDVMYMLLADPESSDEAKEFAQGILSDLVNVGLVNKH